MITNYVTSVKALNDFDKRIVPLLLADLIFAPLMATRQGVSNDLNVIMRDTLIRFSSLFVIFKLPVINNFVQTVTQIGGGGSRASVVVLGIALVHTLHLTLLRIVGMNGTTSDDTKQGRRGTIAQRVMGTQLGVPVVPLADIAIMVAASFIAGGQNQQNQNYLFGVFLYLLALGGREPTTNIMLTLRQYGLPLGAAKAATVILSLGSVALGSSIFSRIVGEPSELLS